MSFNPQSVLVTGGAGFIGCHFVRRLLREDASVRVTTLDALTYAGNADNLADVIGEPRHQLVRGDILDRALIDRLLREQQIDAIVHFAAESHVDRSIAAPAPFIQTNLIGTYTLLEASRQYWREAQGWDAGRCRFHHISTDEVFGSLGPSDPAFHEDTAYAPNSPYSASKAGSDHLVRAYQHTYGLPTVTTNCSNNFGPHQHPEKFIPTVIHACRDRRPIPVYGNGSNIRDWLYVEDHCEGIERVLRAGTPGRTYNIGGHNEHSNLDLARQLCRLMDELHPEAAPHEALIRFVTDRKGHDWRYAIDGRRIQEELGWRARHDFTSALRKTVQWYLR